MHLKELLKFFKFDDSTNIFKYFLSILENLLEINEIKEKFSNDRFLFEFYSCLNQNLIINLTDYYEELFQFLDLINTLSKLTVFFLPLSLREGLSGFSIYPSVC